MKNLKPKELETYRKYTAIQGVPYAKCKINSVVPHTHNTLEHEVAKFVEAYNRIKSGHKIITEAWEKKINLRRDLVDLTEGVAVEIETSKQRAKRHHRPIKIMKVII